MAYVKRLGADGEGWDEGDQKPSLGKALGNFFDDFANFFVKIGQGVGAAQGQQQYTPQQLAYIQQQQQMAAANAAANANKDDTMTYVLIGGAALVAILLLKKKQP